MKITVAIPHYNSLDTLWKLLAQLREGNFDQIIVLDDASDIQPTKVEAEFPAVTFHYGSESVGSAGNRNRILDLVDEGIVWFLDADMEVVSIGNADRLRAIFEKNQNQMVGGLIYTKSGPEMEWNYGHEMHPVYDARFDELAKSLRAGDTSALERLKERDWDYAWLQSGLQQPVKRAVDWVAEGSLALPVELLRKVGGYDIHFAYHQDQDLCRRLREAGVEVTLIPELITRHLEAETPKTDPQEFRESQYLFYKKHWGMSREVYEVLYK